MTDPRIGELYRSFQSRLSADARSFTPEQWETPTPTCPGWTVKGVVSHLAGNVDDILHGRLAGMPTAERTAEQVRARAVVPAEHILDQWDEQTSAFAALMAELEIWLVAFDIATHEFDIRGALSDGRFRDTAELAEIAGVIGRNADIGRPLRIVTETHRIGSDSDDAVELQITDFELFRVRPGRRSAAQVRALDWSEDVGDDALRICVFGPSEVDIVE